MPKSLKDYADPMKALFYRNEQRRNNYLNGRVLGPKRRRTVWSKEEDEMILAHEISDRELSDILNKTVQAIQVRRCRLKKAAGN